jgi:pilus assembly protein CpaC
MKVSESIFSNKTGLAFAWVLLFVCFGYASVKTVHAEGDNIYRKTVHLTSGKAGTVELPKAISDILVASPAVADVGVLRSNRLYVVGRSVGDTNVLAFDDAGNVLAEISVHVRIDEKTVSETLRNFFPEENLEVKTVGDNIVLTGRVSTPSVANQVRDLAGRFITTADQEVVDLMKVAGEQQVMLKVKIVEADRSILREIGVDADYQTDISGSDFNSAVLNSFSGTGLTATNPFASGAIFFSDNDDFGPLQITMQALERDGFINTLAEPNLTAISGESAGFLAGGEFPVPTGVDSQGRIQIEFKQFGVSLDFRPIVLSKDRISLQLASEVSALAEQDNVTLGEGVDIPGLTVRRANTTVEMASGSSLMIAGLIKSETTNALNGLPGVSDIPVLGDLFKSKSFARDETELLIIVTPLLVETFKEPLADAVEPKDTLPPLSKRLQTTLKKIYANKVSDDVTGNAKFGYIVD